MPSVTFPGNRGRLGAAYQRIYCTPIMLVALGFSVAATMLFYDATSLVFVVNMWFVILETKNRSSVEFEMCELMVPTR